MAMTDSSEPTAASTDPAGTRRPDGPHAGLLALIAFGLSIAGIALPLLISGTGYPTPSTPVDTVAAYFTTRAFAGTLTGFFTFATSVPIGIYSATVYARLQRLGIRVPGPNIAFVGGISASILLAASGLLTWALGKASGGVPTPVVHLLADVVFALGGIGFVGGTGLLIAGIAVPALIVRLTPRWLAWVGLVLAAASEVSFLGLLWSGFDILLPVGRFAGLLWLATVGFILPRTRHDVARSERRQR